MQQQGLAQSRRSLPADHRQQLGFVAWPVCLLAAASLFFTTAAAAQPAGDEHSAHHPGAQQPGPARAPQGQASPPQGQASPASGCGPASSGAMGSMCGMHGPATRELYPTLMTVPELTPEVRAAIAQDADQRANRGMRRLNEAIVTLNSVSGNDAGAVTAGALDTLREGIADVETAAAARKALAAGAQPREIAVSWFRQTMNIAPLHASFEDRQVFGVSWLHLAIMAAGAAVTLGLIALYVQRVRGAVALVGRLEVALGPPTPPVATRTGPEGQVPSSLTPIEGMQQGVAATKWAGRLRLSGIYAETPGVKTFRFTNPGGGVPFIHLPGQFVTVEADIEGKSVKRSYTIASSPTQRRYIELTIKREEKGVMSRYMHDHLKVGDEVAVGGPAGFFTFTGMEAKDVVLIAGGVGITPMMSVLRYLADCDWPGDIFFIYGCRTTDDFIFADELAYLQKRLPNLQVVATMTRTQGSPWAGARGRITRSLIEEAIPNVAGRRIHLCGPPAMMDIVKASLRELGTPPEQIKTEAFGPSEPVQRRATEVAAALARARELPAQATVRFARSAKSAPLPADTTILDVADSIGIVIDSACRSGTCGTCKVKLLSGSVSMAVKDALSAEEERAGVILACQAKSAGDVAIDA